MKLERVKAIYDELEKYEVKLDPDPVSRGPRYLQGLIAETRNFLNAVSRLQLEVHQEKQAISRDLRGLEAAFQVSFDLLLANDERIRRLPNIEDRKSTAKVFLRDEIARIDTTKNELQDLEFVEKAIRHRHRELASTMSEIKLQKSLVQAEIHTGAMYGDERVVEVARPGYGPVGVDLDEEALDQLFEQQVREHKASLEALAPAPEPPPAPEPSASVEVPAEVVAAKPTVADVEAFLGASDTTGAALEEDFDDVFSNL